MHIGDKEIKWDSVIRPLTHCANGEFGFFSARVYLQFYPTASQEHQVCYEVERVTAS